MGDMEKKILTFCIFLAPLVFSFAQETNAKEKISYAFGMIIAEDLSDIGLEFDYNQFTRGFSDVMEHKETGITMDEAMDIIDAAFMQINARQMEQRRIEGERNRAEGEAFLAKNAEKPGIVVTPSGLQYEILSEGNGERPGPGDTVLVHYRGETLGGVVFDSSYERGEPLNVPLDMVIAGWSEGLRLTREGSRVRLYIPSDLAYGENGVGHDIGPNELIIFDVELITIIKN
jgi:FKBP-type peptidyl-prolyl cis-trans isomerase FklB